MVVVAVAVVGLGRGGLVVRVGMGMLRPMLSGRGDRVGMRRGSWMGLVSS